MHPCGRHGVTFVEGSSVINRDPTLPGSVNVSNGTHVSRMNLINYLDKVRGCHGDTLQKVQAKV